MDGVMKDENERTKAIGEKILVGVFAAGFLCLSGYIAYWAIVQTKMASDSIHWPIAIGKIESSGLDDLHSTPQVIYTYVVEGMLFKNRQISFAPWNKPGGKGLVDTIIDRYPRGSEVKVYYDRNNPQIAILEPQDYSQFYLSFTWSVLFFVFAAFLCFSFFRKPSQLPRDPRNGLTDKQMRATTVAFSVLFYAAIILVSFDSGAEELHVKLAGEQPLGINPTLFVIAIQTLLFIPFPWVAYHYSKIFNESMKQGKDGSYFSILRIGMSTPALRTSKFVCVGGLVYFITIVAVFGTLRDAVR